ncbi:hbs1p [Saccharomyces arboricola H-6]|uniref:Elongation factor 1 alpha-like protein n=1 Tax=Saccharomyces arboricola (strain H-6 / AS 2.3317 / CBS 10644) TaxID=1160507 RepID=J8Q5H5_SACAR|nr:hbs1p [Saccharomyces arboricola H-6]
MAYSDYSDGADEIADFQDEGEFDDYLNDDEYELMSQVFPSLKKELEGYQGWDNLSLKLALFDNNFDLESTLAELKKTLKKKKKAPRTPTGAATAANGTANIAQALADVSISKAGANGGFSDWLDEEEIGDEHNGDGETDGKKTVQKYHRTTVPTRPKNPRDVAEFIKAALPHLSFVVLGHVDAGKSTLMGRLLYDLNIVNQSQLKKLQRESETVGKSSFKFAWIMDQTNEERERGVTVSICTSHFSTEKANFTIVDAPGHRDFVPNAIMGISQADMAILCVDCSINAFESGFDLDGQTKEHMLLASSLGIRNLIIAMNKMDNVNWSQQRFEEIKLKLLPYLVDIGFCEDNINWVPISGFSGEGVCKIGYTDEVKEWYNGPSLMSTLEKAAFKISKKSEKISKENPFLFSVLEVIALKKTNNELALISGKLESGSIQPGESLTIYPSEQSCVVEKIQVGAQQGQSTTHEETDVAITGDFVTLKLRKAYPEYIQNGDLAASVDYLSVRSAQCFILELTTFEMNRPLLPGTSFIIFIGVKEQPARIKRLISLIDKDNNVTKKKVRHLGSKQRALVEVELIEVKRWIPLLPVNENDRLGRAVLRKDGRTIAAGKITEISE